MKTGIQTNQSGSIVVSLLIIVIVLSSFVYGLLTLANASIVRSSQRVFVLQAQYAAESGADSAVSMLNQGDSTYSGTADEVVLLDGERLRATFETTVEDGSSNKQKMITSTGYVYVPADADSPSYTHTIEVTAEQSGDETANALLSRNIMYFQSGVKTVTATDVYVNEYIYIHRNTSDLIAENITVGGRDPGPGNCSIGGSGNLIKPDSFNDPAQDKTVIRTAYNNCITPPGNSDNADFEVMANQTNIAQVQSTYIPWSYIMDDTYEDSPGTCSDWTSGTSPRTIPSAGNDKLTHYPDSDNGIASDCGTNGSLDLGSNHFIIEDHAHIRADFCGNSGCTPTFENPDDEVKYLFVEGWINFEQLTTTADSGPIVFVSLGSDPAEKASRCPLGASIFLGNSGTTSASAAYFLASNGVCLDRTRFGSEPALGGISGKNIYIATNPGTPFDLALDPDFPYEQIPIDLAWRAVRFRVL